MDLSVVIPARNVADTLPAQLDALLAQSWDGSWEIVVVDNGSTDATPSLVAAYAGRDPRVRLVAAPDKAGLSYARNVGIRSAASENVAICDGDDVVGPNWVAAMGAVLKEHECATGPLLLDELNPPWLARSRGRGNDAGLRYFFDIFPVASGGNLGIRRTVAEKIGGFDEEVGIASDVELSFRLWRAGVEVAFVPEAYLHYRLRDSARDLWRQGRSYGVCRPQICRKVREAGFRPPSRVAGWRSYVWLVVRLPRLRTREGRAVWSWIAGNRFGQLEGCLRHRALYL